jgi:hypothetical protein
MQGTGEAVSLDSARLTKLEKQNGILSRLLAVNFAAVLVLFAVMLETKSTPAIGKIEATSISLRDPHGRVIGEIGSQPGLGNEEDLYRPFIKFWDRGKEPVMTLYGTGLHLVQDDHNATYDFLGINVSSKAHDGPPAEFLVNSTLFSYRTTRGQLMILPTKDGMDLTVNAFYENGEGNNVFGVLTGPEDSSMYVAAHKNEIDITANSRGTQIVRGKGQ